MGIISTLSGVITRWCGIYILLKWINCYNVSLNFLRIVSHHHNTFMEVLTKDEVGILGKC